MSVPHPHGQSSAQAGSSPRRPHAIQPPTLLTATLENAHSAGLGIAGHTPVSTNSLSSPFSAYQHSPYPLSPVGAMRGTSPMAHRATTSFNAAYNPQQWGPVSGGPTPSPSSSSRTMAIRQPQITRVAVLAARPVGPDGERGVLDSTGPGANELSLS